MCAKMSAAARELMYGAPPPPPSPRPATETYTISNCGIGWRQSRCCAECKHLWTGDKDCSPANPECWHPSVKRMQPYPHGPVVNEKHEVEDGCCGKFKERA